MWNQILVYSGVITAIGVIGAGMKYGYEIIRAFIISYNNINLIMTNHLPHIYEELRSINDKLYYLRGSQDHEIREDPPRHD